MKPNNTYIAVEGKIPEQFDPENPFYQDPDQSKEDEANKWWNAYMSADYDRNKYREKLKSIREILDLHTLTGKLSESDFRELKELAKDIY